MDLRKLIDCMTVNERDELRQILIERDNGLTDIYEFIAQNNLKPGLKYALLDLRKGNWKKIRYIQEVERNDFLKMKGAGKKMWEEFKKLRG